MTPTLVLTASDSAWLLHRLSRHLIIGEPEPACTFHIIIAATKLLNPASVAKGGGDGLWSTMLERSNVIDRSIGTKKKAESTYGAVSEDDWVGCNGRNSVQGPVIKRFAA